MSLRVVVLLAAIARVAAADPLVSWRAPPGCPNADDVNELVARRVGDARPPAPIDVAVHAGAAGFVAEIGGVRTLTSATCGDLAEAVALIVARMVLDALAPVLGAPPPPPDGLPPPPPPGVPQDDDIEPPAPPFAPAPPPFGIGMRLSAIGSFGAQPRGGFGGELAVPMHWRALLVEPAGSLSVPSTASMANGGVAVSLRTATMRVGWRPAHLPLRAWATAQIGELVGSGENIFSARTGTALWASIGGGLAAVWRFYGPLAAVASVEVTAPLGRTTFTLADGQPLYRPSAVVECLAAGLEVVWP